MRYSVRFFRPACVSDGRGEGCAFSRIEAACPYESPLVCIRAPGTHSDMRPPATQPLCATKRKAIRQSRWAHASASGIWDHLHLPCTYAECCQQSLRRISLIVWWKGRDSNPRPRHYEPAAPLKIGITFNNLSARCPLHLSRRSTTEQD